MHYLLAPHMIMEGIGTINQEKLHYRQAECPGIFFGRESQVCHGGGSVFSINGRVITSTSSNDIDTINNILNRR